MSQATHVPFVRIGPHPDAVPVLALELETVEEVERARSGHDLHLDAVVLEEGAHDEGDFDAGDAAARGEEDVQAPLGEQHGRGDLAAGAAEAVREERGDGAWEVHRQSQGSFLPLAMSKRALSPTGALIKRARLAESDPALVQLVVASDGNAANKGALIQTVRRTSGLAAPIMCLQVRPARHGVAYSAGSLEGGARYQILPRRRVARVRQRGQDHPPLEHVRRLQKVSFLGRENVADRASYGVLRIPRGAPTSIAFVNARTLVAGSTDHFVFLFNLKTGEVIRRFKGHYGVVNSVDVQCGGAGRDLIVSGSDDGTVRVWQAESPDEVEIIELNYPITAVRPYAPRP